MLRGLIVTWALLSGMAVSAGAVAYPAPASGQAHPQDVPVHIVYHLDTDAAGTMTALHQMQNELAVAPTTKIVAVAIGKSVPFMTKDAITKGGYPFKLMIQVLQESGVQFEACDNTMKTLKINANQLDDGIKVVPSGMAEIARLEWYKGYVYIKP